MREIPQVFPAFIYYDRPLEHLLKMVPSVCSLNLFTSKNFPAAPDEVGDRKIDFRLYGFEEKVRSNIVIGQMRKDDCRPATLRSLLAFWIFNPTSFWCGHNTGFWKITALGSLWTPPQEFFEQSPGINFGTLRLDSNQTGMYSEDNDQREFKEWGTDWLFLAVK